LPVAEDLWRYKVVEAHWPIFGCSEEKSHLLTDAITKIYENRDQLLKVKQNG